MAKSLNPALLGCLLGALFACVDIQRTEPPPGSGSGGSPSGAGGSGNEGGSSFVPNECLQACADTAPEGQPTFFEVASCTEGARADVCAEACAADAPASMGASSCPVPGPVDPVLGCSNCLKERCCASLQRCFTEAACITVGICASGCP